jgi:hypothetical protein
MRASRVGNKKGSKYKTWKPSSLGRTVWLRRAFRGRTHVVSSVSGLAADNKLAQHGHEQRDKLRLAVNSSFVEDPFELAPSRFSIPSASEGGSSA